MERWLRRWIPLALALIVLTPIGSATTYDMSACGPAHDEATTTNCDPDGARIPDLVTGHTIYTAMVLETDPTGGTTQSAPPSDHPITLPGQQSGDDPGLATSTVVDAHQRECLVWFDGRNLDHRPDPDDFDPGNDFPTDEDEPAATDSALQDYDFDRDVSGCGPETAPGSGRFLGLPTDFAGLAGFFAHNVRTLVQGTEGPELGWVHQYGDYAVIVERGDCDPAAGTDFRYRGHLDFTDPNGVYHEVQEYDYTCLASTPQQYAGCAPGTLAAGLAHDTIPPQPGSQDTGVQKPDGENLTTPDGSKLAAAARDAACTISPGSAGAGAGRSLPGAADLTSALFPWTYTDPDNDEGCEYKARAFYEVQEHEPNAPGAGLAADDEEGSPAVWADDGNNTNRTIIVHEGHLTWFDLGHKCNGTIQDLFKERLWITRVHAPILDARLGTYYTFALLADTCSGLNIYEPDGRASEDNTYDGRGFPGHPVPGGSSIERLYRDLQPYAGDPVPDACTDGSSFSFDDGARARTTHAAAPETTSDAMRGLSHSGHGPWGHREDCRFLSPLETDLGWPLNDPYPAVNGACFPEDHATAQADLRVYDFDPTGLFEANALTTDWVGSSGEGRAEGT